MKSLIKTNTRNFVVLSIFASTLFLSGCGKFINALRGGFKKTTIQGVVMYGPIEDGVVTGYAVNPDGTKGTVLGTTTSDASGSFSLTLNVAS